MQKFFFRRILIDQVGSQINIILVKYRVVVFVWLWKLVFVNYIIEKIFSDGYSLIIFVGIVKKFNVLFVMKYNLDKVRVGYINRVILDLLFICWYLFNN